MASNELLPQIDRHRGEVGGLGSLARSLSACTRALRVAAGRFGRNLCRGNNRGQNARHAALPASTAADHNGISDAKRLDFSNFATQSAQIGIASLGKETLMKQLLAAMATTGIAGVGGALAVYGSYDDSPGGTLLGIVIVLGAMALSARMARRAPSTQPERAGA